VTGPPLGAIESSLGWLLTLFAAAGTVLIGRRDD
jgi:hypothetical protein